MTLPVAFSRKVFEEKRTMSRIGGGTLGGKANGLLFIEETLRNRFDAEPVPKTAVGIPWMTVLGADCFAAFMEKNALDPAALSERPDHRIAHEFQSGDLPAELVGDLRAIADQVRVPLAVRSSSLLEDALFRPFAGVYATKMIPNNQPSPDDRYKKLVEAIKFVYASAFFKKAREYARSIDEEICAEKMAVIIQEMVGRRYGDRFYPNLSGVARSHNYYPYGHARPEDGVVSLALGLGKTIVDGGRVWSFCPAFPKSPPPYNNTRDLLNNTQTEFWAVNMAKPKVYDPLRETEYMARFGVAEAEYDDTLRFVASTYDPRSDRVVMGVGADGPRVLDFAPILALNDVPLNDAVAALLALCEEALGAEVEIEFAMTFDKAREPPYRLGFLQVRPMVVSGGSVEVTSEAMNDPNAIVATDKALGNSTMDDIDDIVYVLPESFDPKYGWVIANELEKINSALAKDHRPYLLIGFGRWGTSDPWRGVPVTWDQISRAKVIVEAEIRGAQSEVSQGSHFFHNLTSFKVAYLSVSAAQERQIDFEWIQRQEEISATRFVRHVRAARPLSIRVDGRSRRGVIRRHEG